MDFLYNFYITLVFYFKIIWESQTNFLNNIRILKRKRATLPKNLSNKTVIITGANSGIGKATAKIFAQFGAKVIMLCRDLDKGKVVYDEILKELNVEMKDFQNLILEKLDLASMKSVRECATRINNKVSKIDYLINNAGIMMCSENKTEDGIELQFATNYLGHFLLTNLLLDKIKAAPSARIINLSSIAHIPGKIHIDNINLKGIYTPSKSYFQSKLANVLFTVELAKRLQGTNVKVFAVHPGLVDTDLKRHLNSWFQCFLNFLHRIILISPELGAQTTLYCAFETNIENESGKYFENCQVKKMLPHTIDENNAKKLWEMSLTLCELENNKK